MAKLIEEKDAIDAVNTAMKDLIGNLQYIKCLNGDEICADPKVLQAYLEANKSACKAIKKVPSRKTEDLLDQDDLGTLFICAIRYCQGRRTYMPDLVREIIRPHLKELSDKDLAVMIQDCDYQRQFNLYGDDRIDKPGWIKWEKELLDEKERRNNG